MSIVMPQLEEGQVFRHEEVQEYVCKHDNTNDYGKMNTRFPLDLQKWPEHDPNKWRADGEMLLQYRVYKMADFRSLLDVLEEKFATRNDHQNRVAAIVELLHAGQRFYPVFVQQDDPQRRIFEGNHRAIALRRLECPLLPTFLAGYRDWFDSSPRPFNSESKP